jgi:hypothetical protein
VAQWRHRRGVHLDVRRSRLRTSSTTRPLVPSSLCRRSRRIGSDEHERPPEPLSFGHVASGVDEGGEPIAADRMSIDGERSVPHRRDRHRRGVGADRARPLRRRGCNARRTSDAHAGSQSNSGRFAEHARRKRPSSDGVALRSGVPSVRVVCALPGSLRHHIRGWRDDWPTGRVSVASDAGGAHRLATVSSSGL